VSGVMNRVLAKHDVTANAEAARVRGCVGIVNHVGMQRRRRLYRLTDGNSVTLPSRVSKN
jgi:hypothetical protein